LNTGEAGRNFFDFFKGMTKQEILDLEQSNSDKIHLLQEGSFWIAYEKSAFRFVRTVKPYEVKKKRVKIVDCEVVSLGFPVSALDKIVSEGGLEIVERGDKRITLRAPDPLTDEAFESWKADLELFIPDSKPTSELDRGGAGEVKPPHVAAESDFGMQEVIVRRILDFGIENSTPMECMLFVSELKRQIREYRNKEAQL
jgi:hypothetical protein